MAVETLGRTLANRGQHAEAVAVWERRIPAATSSRQRASLFLLIAKSYFGRFILCCDENICLINHFCSRVIIYGFGTPPIPNQFPFSSTIHISWLAEKGWIIIPGQSFTM